MADFKNIHVKISQLKKYVQHSVPVIIGTEAVNHFKDSFQNEGFTDENLVKWEDVKRRDASSSWYGFNYIGEKQKKGERKANKSSAAQTRKILSGNTQELGSAIDWEQSGNVIRILAKTKYSQIHNEGGDVSVFGKHKATMPKRQFMGASAVLKRKIETMITNDINKILK